MEKQGRSDIATFPELFSSRELRIDEFGGPLRRTGRRLAKLAIPASVLLLLALSKVA